MTTLDLPPTFRGFMAIKLASLATKRRSRTKQASNRAVAVLNATVRLMLHVIGFSFLTWAGFTFNMTAGLIVAGCSCFVMSKLMTDPATDETEVRAPDLRNGR